MIHCVQVMTFGQGDIGQLGQGESVDERKRPFPVGGELEGKRVVQVVCGGMHTVALTDQGEVRGCGLCVALYWSCDCHMVWFTHLRCTHGAAMMSVHWVVQQRKGRSSSRVV